jgi:hypothetical protein
MRGFLFIFLYRNITTQLREMDAGYFVVGVSTRSISLPPGKQYYEVFYLPPLPYPPSLLISINFFVYRLKRIVIQLPTLTRKALLPCLNTKFYRLVRTLIFIIFYSLLLIFFFFLPFPPLPLLSFSPLSLRLAHAHDWAPGVQRAI